jgi:hypothetical protein
VTAVPSLSTVSVTALLVLEAKLLLPTYSAVWLWLPAVRVLV